MTLVGALAVALVATLLPLTAPTVAASPTADPGAHSGPTDEDGAHGGHSPDEHSEHDDHAAMHLRGHGTVDDALAGEEDPAAGVVFDGLEVAPPGSPCAGMFEIEVNDVVSCTPGPTRAPEGADVRQRPPIEADERRASPTSPAPDSGYAALAGAPAVPCIGDGIDGARIHVLYVRAADVADRYALVRDDIVGWAADTAVDIDTSAMDHAGVHRYPRFLTTPVEGGCELVVENVVIPSNADDDVSKTIDAVYDLGFTDTDRKYLMYVDSNIYCGIAQVFPDDEPTQHNINNGNDFSPMYARIDAYCWGDPVVTTHELLHTLGAVQPGSPNATPYGHCTDEWDIMCYRDADDTTLRLVCPDSSPRQDLHLDCNGDDYFDPTPTAGSWLAGHWNTANSRWLSASTGPGVVGAPRPPARSPNERFIRAAYEDFLDRFATSAEVAAVINDVGSRAERAAWLRDLGYSRAYVGAVVTRFYRDTLGREPDATGKKNWVDAIISGRKTTARVAAEFYASEEYFLNLGGGTNRSWVTDLYRKLLFREPDEAGLDHWTNVAAQRGRVAVAVPFYRAPETLGVRVDLLYLRFLGRFADSSGKQHWSSVIRRSGNDVDLAISLASSAEYFQRSQYR